MEPLITAYKVKFKKLLTIGRKVIMVKRLILVTCLVPPTLLLECIQQESKPKTGAEITITYTHRLA